MDMECDDTEGYNSDENYKDCFEDEEDIERSNGSVRESVASTNENENESDDDGCWTYKSDSDTSFDPDDYDTEDDNAWENILLDPEDVHDWWKREFLQTVARIARNDEDVDELIDWLGEMNGYSWEWTDDYLTLLGVSIAGNTHLQSLRIKLGKKDLDQEFDEDLNDQQDNEAEFDDDGDYQDEENSDGGGEIQYEESFEEDDEAELEVLDDEEGEAEPENGNDELNEEAVLQDEDEVPARELEFEDEGRDTDSEYLDGEQDDDAEFARGARALARGISKSHLQCLTLVGAFGPFKHRLLSEAGVIWKLEKEAVTSAIPAVDVFMPPPPVLEQPSRAWSRLTVLSLQQCQLEAPDMLTLCVCLAMNPWLKIVALKQCRVTDVGIFYFCQHWSTNSPLEVLDLSFNRITSTGAQMLLQASTNHPVLKMLKLSGNHLIGWDGLQMIGEHLPRITLQTLDIAHVVALKTSREARNAARLAVANGLRDNASLSFLSVGGNCLGGVGAQLLMRAVAAHPSLEGFSLAWDHTIGLEGMKRIGRELPNVRLKELYLDNIFPNIVFPPVAPTPKLELEARNAIFQGIQNNFHLQTIRFGGGGAHVDSTGFSVAVRFFLGANEFRPLFTSSAMAPAVWPHAMAHTQPSYIYFILSEQPWLASHAGEWRS